MSISENTRLKIRNTLDSNLSFWITAGLAGTAAGLMGASLAVGCAIALGAVGLKRMIVKDIAPTLEEHTMFEGLFGAEGPHDFFEGGLEHNIAKGTLGAIAGAVVASYHNAEIREISSHIAQSSVLVDSVSNLTVVALGIASAFYGPRLALRALDETLTKVSNTAIKVAGGSKNKFVQGYNKLRP